MTRLNKNVGARFIEPCQWLAHSSSSAYGRDECSSQPAGRINPTPTKKRKTFRRWNSQHGFTTLELLVAILIVLLLATASIAVISRIEVWANVAQAKTEITQISMAVEMEKYDTGSYILNLADLGSPSPSAPSGISNRTWKGPYLNGDFLLDPWGNDYTLTLIRDEGGNDTPVSATNQHHYLITSCGADKQPGGTGLNADIIWHSDYAGFKD